MNNVSKLAERITQVVKILNSSSAKKITKKQIVDALKEHDCDPKDPISLKLLDDGYVYPDRFFDSLEIHYDDSPRYRLAWNILNGSDERKSKQSEESQILKLLKDQRPVGQWKDQELLEAYGKDCDVEVEDALKKKSFGAPIIVFKDESEGIVDIDASIKCLRMSRRRECMPMTMRFDGKLKRLHHVGEFPAMIVFQCPFHKDVILYDGYCDRDDVDWSGVGYEAMQFARLVFNTDEHPTKHRDVESFIEVAKKGIGALDEEYPRIGLQFEELDREDSLPNLKQRHSVAREVKDPVRASGSNRSY